MHNRVQRALARRERMRRSRDYAWTIFAAAAAAGAFGWILLLGQVLSDVRTQWWVVLVYAGIGVIASYVALRAFGTARRFTRRLDEDQPLSAANDAADHASSVWGEIWGRKRG
jgi:hypothetical protein